MGERIHKRLAQAGVASRRQVETWVEEGRIKINGKVAEIGQSIEETDSVSVDGRLINLRKSVHQPTRVLLYKKKAGEVVTREDPEKRPTIFKRLPRLEGGRWIAIGRLDINTSGLLLLTNDGELAKRLMHPSYEVEREYAVRVHGEVTPEMLQALKDGVELDDGIAKFEAIKEAAGKEGDGRNQWYHVILREGRNREVRRLWESQGVEVSRLMRVRFGPISLTGGIKAGTAVELNPEGVRVLCAAVQYPVVLESGRPGKSSGKAKSKPSAKAAKPAKREPIEKRATRGTRGAKVVRSTGNMPRADAGQSERDIPAKNPRHGSKTESTGRSKPAASDTPKDSPWGRSKR